MCGAAARRVRPWPSTASLLAVVTLAVVASLAVLSGGISTTFENLAAILPG